MDSSSNDSFAWTDASNDSKSSIAASVGSMIKNNVTDEESDNKLKKNLHKELFSETNDNNESDHDSKKKKKNKRKLERDVSDSEYNSSPKKKKVKVEPESDVDHKPIIKKMSHTSLTSDELYLDQKVKEEQNASARANKTTNNIQANELDNTNISKTKKKKSRKRKTTSDIEDADANNTYIEVNNVNSEDDRLQINGDDTTIYQDSTINSTMADVSEISKISTVNTTNNDSFHLQDGASHKRRKISDKIMFEEELEESDATTNHDGKKPTSSRKRNGISKKLKQFAEQMTDLMPLNKQNDITLTEDDEIWVVRCPRQVSVSSFKDKNLNLENKCKIKLNGVTYEGIANNTIGSISVAVSDNGRFYIKNLPIEGYVSLHKRMHKVHIPEENVSKNVEPTFIPLPETKCRHPLLGYDYKKAIKLPASIAERLRTSHMPSTTSKKRKKYKVESTEELNIKTKVEVECERGPVSEHTPGESFTKKKKKKKRKHSETHLPRTTHDPESAENWGSETAIEENLFNF